MIFHANMATIESVGSTRPSLITALHVLKRLPCVNIVVVIIIIIIIIISIIAFTHLVQLPLCYLLPTIT